MPTAAIWTGIETAMPVSQAAISPENAALIQEVGRWGKGIVIDAIYSPDGKQIAVATPLGVYFYDAETTQQLRFIQAKRELTAMAISADWQLIALGYARPGSIDLYTINDDRLLRSFETRSGEVVRLVFTPGGDILLAGIRYTGVIVWRVHEGTQLDTLPANYVQLDFVEEGETAVTYADGVLQLWQLKGEELQEIPSNIILEENVGAIKLSPDGQLLAVGEVWGLQVWVWRLSDQTLLYTMDTTPPASAATSWRHFGKPVYRSGPGQHYINDIAFSPDGKTLAVTNGFSELTMWDLNTGELHRRVEAAGLNVTYTPDGARLATWEHTLAQWQAKDGLLLNTLNQHIGYVTSLAFMPDGINLAIGSLDGFIYLRRVSDGALYRRLQDDKSGVTSIAVSADGSRLISGSADHTIRFWKTAANTFLINRALSGYEMEHITISANGQYAISAVSDGGLHLWQVDNGQLLEWGFGFGGMALQPVAFSPTEMLFATVKDEDHLGLWPGTAVFGKAQLLSGPAELWASTLAFSADGQLLAAASSDGQLWLWRVSDGELLFRLEEALPDMTSIEHLAFSPDGQLLAAISGRKVLLWHVSDRTFLHTITMQHGRPKDIAFSPNGRYLAIGSADGTVRLWGVP